jgi:hypothetical protein
MPSSRFFSVPSSRFFNVAFSGFSNAPSLGFYLHAPLRVFNLSSLMHILGIPLDWEDSGIAWGFLEMRITSSKYLAGAHGLLDSI